MGVVGVGVGAGEEGGDGDGSKAHAGVVCGGMLMEVWISLEMG